MKIRKGDQVIIRSGKEKGKTGKVLSVDPRLQRVTIDGINISKRHTKPSKKNAQGGVFEILKPLPVSKVGLIHPEDKKRSSRIGFSVSAKSGKTRVYRQANNKEVK